jgi:hypothetical protein
MKYEIDTIPVWDALRAGTECPLCLLERRSRNAALRYFLGPSVMVPEVRVSVNQTGFRPETLRLLSRDPNKLGLALISHTRLKALHAKLAEKTKGLRAEAEKAARLSALQGAVGGKALREHLARAVAFLRDEEAQCLVEDKVKLDLERYAYTLVHLWLKDPEFRPVWAASPGACLHHTPALLEMASEQLPAPALGSFTAEFLDGLDKTLSRVENDVLAFTQTFDSTHSHTPSGNPQGALDRCLQRMAGLFPEYEDDAKSRKGPLMGGVSST